MIFVSVPGNRMAEQLMERIMLIRRQDNELEAVFSSMTEAVLAVEAEECVIRMKYRPEPRRDCRGGKSVRQGIDLFSQAADV